MPETATGGRTFRYCLCLLGHVATFSQGEWRGANNAEEVAGHLFLP